MLATVLSVFQELGLLVRQRTTIQAVINVRLELGQMSLAQQVLLRVCLVVKEPGPKHRVGRRQMSALTAMKALGPQQWEQILLLLA